MPILPDVDKAQRLKNLFTQAGYSGARLTAGLGIASPPQRHEIAAAMQATRELTPLNALARLFLLGQSVNAEAWASLFTDADLVLCSDAEIVSTSDDRIFPQVVVVPVGDLLVTSHAFSTLGTDKADEFVLPASTQSTRFLSDLTLREPVANTLDLGCGCGIHALLAAAHSESVVATDISESALQFTQFNARLNQIDNVECIQGSLFEPVAGSSFDLIVSNPPFVISPSQSYSRRENALDLDAFCGQLLQEAPAFLNEGGHLQMLCEWVQIQGEGWQQRLKDWTTGTGCDAWILRGTACSPVEYATRRLGDEQTGTDNLGITLAEWVTYLESRQVETIHPGMITLRRRAAENWMHVHAHAGDVSSDAALAVRESIAAQDFLQLCEADETLLQAVLEIPGDLGLTQEFERGDGLWAPAQARLHMANSVSMEAEVDVSIIAFLNQIDGNRTVGESITTFCSAASIDPGQVQDQLLSAIRLFVSRRFLRPADI